MVWKLQTGCVKLDKALSGGIPSATISLVYGSAGSGKTTLSLQLATQCARKSMRAIYVDGDQSFSSRRLQLIAGDQTDELAPWIIIFTPEDFSKQEALIESLENYLTPKTALLVVDTITAPYRSALGSAEKTFQTNRELNRQLAYLSGLAKKYDLPVFCTSQVHSRPWGSGFIIEPLAKRLLDHWCGTIIRLSNTANPSIKQAVVEQSSGKKIRYTCVLSLTQKGMEDTELYV